MAAPYKVKKQKVKVKYQTLSFIFYAGFQMLVAHNNCRNNMTIVTGCCQETITAAINAIQSPVALPNDVIDC